MESILMGFKLPWSIQFVLRWQAYFDLPSTLKIREYVLSNPQAASSETFQFRMKKPAGHALTVRSNPADLFTLEEVFGNHVYQNTLPYLGERPNIIDLGGNIGLTSLYYLIHRSKANIFIVEPNSDNFALLKSNLGRFVDSGQVNLVRGALWGKSCDLVIRQPDALSNSCEMREATESDSRQDFIAGLSMVDLIAQSKFQVIDLLKVDIEGAEVELFNSDISWLTQTKALAVEFHGAARGTCDFDRKIKKYGFQVAHDDNHTVVAIQQ
jgi:FkbM family methyltransferase